MLALVRYIHLNPLHAKVVKSLTESDKHPYSGHSGRMGKVQRDLQGREDVLRLFREKVPAARRII